MLCCSNTKISRCYDVRAQIYIHIDENQTSTYDVDVRDGH